MSLWLKQCGVQKAQYVSGIRYASSTLRYWTIDVAKLEQKFTVAHLADRYKRLFFRLLD